MADGIPLDPWKQVTLTREQAAAYLERIQLPPSTLSSPPSLSLLSQLLQSQLENIPKDTTPMHVSEAQWSSSTDEDDDEPIKLTSALDNMPEGTIAFDRIVTQHKGAFCFAVNPTFSAFLRAFGFRVSELVGRTFKNLNNDPLTHADGWKWGTYTHGFEVVDWPGSEKRYLVDAAWGPWACPVPIPLENGATVLGLNPYEAFRLVNEQLPLGANQTAPIDSLPGWTMYRLVRPPASPSSADASAPPLSPLTLPLPSDSDLRTQQGAFWTPQFHFQLVSVPLLDYRLYHHFSASHSIGSFYAFFLVTRLLPGTGGARRSLMFAEKEGETTRRAKVFTTGGDEAKGSLESRDVEWVEMKVGPMKRYLAKEFGFKW
ncbi:hypothetical protein JCM10908_000843 [Rhodotorula pacifica]|uniref:uncharacterized protein n=1 Tax=Rhodotorula pacifica TaxID=1495444 RepID=UPI003171AFEF